ncbi:unnamed protein product [Mesocestoides corti]|uniref:PH domain-containing protein n=1 Tax=Mesocestoides corti TaxID=53468 RepID=A0A158QSL5_MESCO|nr:unnamed protein product [Mesocestoides corti]
MVPNASDKLHLNKLSLIWRGLSPPFLQLQQVAGEPEHHSSSKEPHSFSLSGEIAVDGQSLSTLPPLYQSPRKQSSQFGSDVFLSRAGRTTSMQDLDHEIDMLLEDLTATCLQKDHSIIRTMTRGEPAQHHFPRRLKVSTGARTDGELALPELATYLKVCKPRMFGIKTYRRFYVVLKKTTLFLFKNQEDFQHSHPPIETICILGCESWPDLSPTADRFAIRIFTPMIRNALPLSSALTRDVTSENATLTTRLKRRASLLSLTSLGGLSAVCGKAVSRVSGLLNEVIIRLPDEAHYVEWWAAVRLAGSLSSCHAAATPETVRRLFDAEKRATTSLLQLLTPLPLKITSLNVDRTSMEDRMWLQRNFTVALPYRLAGEQAGRWGEGTHTWTQGKTVDAGAPGGGSLPPAKEEANERLIRHILDIRSRLPEMKAVDIKLQYISHWQQLTGNGVIYFVARFEASVPIEAALGLPSDTPDQAYRASTLNSSHVHTSTRQLTISVSRRDEVVGIGNGRVARHDQSTGEIYAAWRLDTIQGWNVNRELNELVLLLAPTPNPADRPGDNAASPDASRKSDHPGGGRVIIRPVGVPVQKVSEVLGANVFLSLRSPTKSQELDENLFYRLIGASPAKTVSSNAVR